MYISLQYWDIASSCCAPVDKVVVESEVENEGFELSLELETSISVLALARLEDVS